MTDTTTRKRGRPKDTEINPLAKLMKRRIRIDVGDNRVSRKAIGTDKKRSKAPKPRLDRAQAPTRNSDVDAVIERIEARAARQKAMKDAARAPAVLATPPIAVEDLPNPYTGKSEKLVARPSFRDVVKKWNCRDGIHIKQFVKDYEMVGKDLSAASFDPTTASSGGGKPTPFPERKIDAARRLAELRRFLAPGQYDLVVAVVIYGVGLAKLHKEGAEQHVVARREVNDALDAMGRFYTPDRIFSKRTWDAATRIVQELERLAK